MIAGYYPIMQGFHSIDLLKVGAPRIAQQPITVNKEVLVGPVLYPESFRPASHLSTHRFVDVLRGRQNSPPTLRQQPHVFIISFLRGLVCCLSLSRGRHYHR